MARKPMVLVPKNTLLSLGEFLRKMRHEKELELAGLKGQLQGLERAIEIANLIPEPSDG